MQRAEYVASDIVQVKDCLLVFTAKGVGGPDLLYSSAVASYNRRGRWTAGRRWMVRG